MASIDSLDFLNTNSLRNFPIKEGGSRISSDGNFIIPNDFIVDMQLAVSYDPSKRFYISKISNFDDNIIIEISDESSALVGSFTIVISNHWQYKEYALTPSASFANGQGLLCVTSLTSIQNQPSGVFTFLFGNTELEPRVSVLALQGINRLIFTNTNGTSYALSGDVVIEARANIRFKLADNTDNSIIIDAGNGLGLNSVCSDQLTCIKTINGIPPDSNGNFTFDFSDCATLTPIPADTGLLLEDICCKPCVGCDDIEELTTRLMTTETGLLNLTSNYNKLLNLFTNFQTTSSFSCACPPPD